MASKALKRGQAAETRFFWRVAGAHHSKTPPFRADRCTGRRPGVSPRTGWRNYISQLAWEHLTVPQEERQVLPVRRRRRWWWTGAPGQVCCHRRRTSDRQKRVDGWTKAEFLTCGSARGNQPLVYKASRFQIQQNTVEVIFTPGTSSP